MVKLRDRDISLNISQLSVTVSQLRRHHDALTTSNTRVTQNSQRSWTCTGTITAISYLPFCSILYLLFSTFTDQQLIIITSLTFIALCRSLLHGPYMKEKWFHKSPSLYRLLPHNVIIIGDAYLCGFSM